MKKHIKFSFFLLISAFALTSCEEVIDVDLNTTDPKIVIEGSVTDQAEPFKVSINKTVNFDQANEYPAVSGALVTISDGTQTFTLNETAPGVYKTSDAQKGEPGRTYHLRVEAEGQVFEARSEMSALVKFDSLWQDKLNLGGQEAITVVSGYQDPLGLGNYYRFVLWRNGSILSDIDVRDDKNSDGRTISQPIFVLSEDLEVNDTIRVEMQTIDKPIYKYFYALAASAGNGPNASVPGNPVSNLSGGALGYFSAHTSQEKTVIIR